mmetsp:Transcript_20526/g.39875  ORF Transcript_20526/g.39875 Transcript_20526/m.39875 type:complete len:83 (-) Transcript_20526:242-490(-)
MKVRMKLRLDWRFRRVPTEGEIPMGSSILIPMDPVEKLLGHAFRVPGSAPWSPPTLGGRLEAMERLRPLFRVGGVPKHPPER